MLQSITSELILLQIYKNKSKVYLMISPEFLIGAILRSCNAVFMGTGTSVTMRSNLLAMASSVEVSCSPFVEQLDHPILR